MQMYCLPISPDLLIELDKIKRNFTLTLYHFTKAWPVDRSYKMTKLDCLKGAFVFGHADLSSFRYIVD